MLVLEMLETTTDTTVEEFLAEVTAASELATSWDNRPTWDNWSKR